MEPKEEIKKEIEIIMNMYKNKSKKEEINKHKKILEELLKNYLKDL